MTRTPAMAATATSTCRGCDATISADSPGSVWDAIAELGRKRQLAGWTSADGLHRCRECAAALRQHQAGSRDKALPGLPDSDSVEVAPGDQGAPTTELVTRSPALGQPEQAGDP